MSEKPHISELTDVDVVINDGMGIFLNRHSGVVELAIRKTEYSEMSCGCCTDMSYGYTTQPIDKMDICRMIDGYAEVMSEYYDKEFEDSLGWLMSFDKHKEN